MLSATNGMVLHWVFVPNKVLCRFLATQGLKLVASKIELDSLKGLFIKPGVYSCKTCEPGLRLIDEDSLVLFL